MKQFTGTGVALVTPFTPDGKVDATGLNKLVNHVIDGGVDFLVVLGTTGEAATLSAAEQDTVIQTVIGAAEGRVDIVLGAGGNNTAKICKQVEDFARFFPDGYLSVSPYYNKPTQEGIFQHFKAVAGCTDLPIIAYNVPGRTSSNMLAATTLRIAHEIPNIVSIKEASGNVEQGMDIIREKPEGFTVLSGDDVLIVPQIAAGYDGVISVMANAMAEDFCGMVQAARDGNFVEARRLQFKILKLMQLNFAEGNPAGVKALLSLLKICGPEVRLPLVKASDSLTEAIKKELARIGQP